MSQLDDRPDGREHHLAGRPDAPQAKGRTRLGWAVAATGLVIVAAMIAIGLVRIASGSSSPGEGAPASPPPASDAVASSTPARVGVLEAASFVNLRNGKVTSLPTSVRSIQWATDFRASPDGSKLAFDDGLEIYVAGIDGSHLRSITPGTVSAVAPTWSPDGTRLVYLSGGDLFVADVRSAASNRPRHLPGQVWLPSFSPDGRSILFTMTSGGGMRIDLWSMPADGGEPHRLLRNAAFGSYSPDGTTIAFHPVRQAVEGGSMWPWDFGLALVDADGTRLRRLTAGAGCCTMAYVDWNWTRPAWSPDGKRIAYQPFGQPPDKLQVVDVATGHETFIGSGALASWVDDDTLIVKDYRRGPPSD